MRRHLLGLAVAVAAFLSTALPAAANWSPQTSGTTNTVRDVECPTAQRCYAVGIGGVIRLTTDGGASWSAPQSTVATAGLYGVSCTSETRCFAVGDLGLVIETTDGGANWSSRRTGGGHLISIDCPSATSCWTVGHGGAIHATTDGGSTWTTQSSGTAEDLFGVACPTTATCWAVGHNGTILVKGANSASWAQQQSPVTGKRLDGISCPTATTCTVSGEGGTLLRTDTAGALWTRQPTPFGHYFFDVECPSAATCWAVASAGTIIGTVNGGVTWDPEDPGGVTTTLTGVGCATVSVCKATGDAGVILTRGGVATGRSSADCETAPGSQNVLDGFAGDAYVRVRTARPTAKRTWVCFRIDNGTSIRQGGLIEIETDANAGGASVDDQAGACSTATPNYAPGPHPLIDAAIGDPAEPPYVPITVDTLRHNEAAWVCVRAGGERRRVVVTVPDVEVPTVTHFPDGAGATPPPDSPPAGLPSSSCQTAGGNRVLNMDVATAHVWLYTLQPAPNEANVCVRVEGPVAVGGVLGLKAQVGVPVSVTRSQDTSPCTIGVVTVGSPADLRISRTPTGAIPASVCVETGSTRERVTVDTSGSLVLPIPTWTPDPGTPGG